MELVTYLTMVILGACFMLLLNLNEAYAKADFSWRIFIKQNWLATLCNIVIGVVVVIAEYDATSPLFEITKFSSLMLGAASQVIFKKLVNMFTASKGTAIGINKTDNTQS
jgi:hypothetical protein